MQGGRYRLHETEYEQIHAAFGLPVWSRPGDAIRYRILPAGEPTTKTLVPGRSREEGELRTTSPLGHALLGRSVGDVVRVVLPRGPVQIEILDVQRPD
jgi:transcription elongation GreA/GreB family factor